MGRPRLKIIDDAQEAEVKASPKKKIEKAAKAQEVSESVIASDAEGGTKQSSSEENPTQIATPRRGEALDDKKKKSQKPGKSKPRSKKYQELTKDLDRNQLFSLPEAVEMVKKLSYSKFNATLEAHINTAQTGIRGLVSLPFATGHKLRILVFGKGAETLTSVILNGAKRSEESPTNVGLKQVERSFANAQDDTIKVGSDETIEEINKGKVDFDLILTTPEWMPKLAKIARVLGPRGLMPNPKNGTITEDLKKAVEGFQAGKTEFKTEAKAPVIHLSLGKLNQPTEELIANIKILYQTIGKSRVKKISLSPTMGPSVKLDLASI